MRLTLLFLAASTVWAAFAPSPAAVRVVAGSRSSVIVAAEVPELYVYDHCPFCVRVRMAMGLKGIQHKLVFMGNDDVETPTALVGKKIAPIWVDGDGPMAESLGKHNGSALPCPMRYFCPFLTWLDWARLGRRLQRGAQV